MIDYASRQRASRKHVIGLTAVVVLHGLLFWAINSGLARKSGIDGPKQQPVQHNHRSQTDHMLSGCSLPAGVIYHVVFTLSVTQPLQMQA